MTTVAHIDVAATQIPLLEQEPPPEVDASWVRLPRAIIETSALEASATPFVSVVSGGARTSWESLSDLYMSVPSLIAFKATFTVTATAPTVTGSGVVDWPISGDQSNQFFPDEVFGLAGRLLCQSRLHVLVPSRRRIIEGMAIGFDVAQEADTWPPASLPSQAPSGDAIRAGSDQHAGLRAVDNLRRWLNLTVSEIARLADLGESTVYWWAEHPGSVPRPAKIDRLLGLEAVVAGLVEELGVPATAQWFRRGDPAPLTRLREDPGSFTAIEEAAYRYLIERANARLSATGPSQAVTERQYTRDIERLATEEREAPDPISSQVMHPHELEPDERA